ncbi:MAG: uracil-DNA glycosylase [Rhodocyclaceae bacterium]|nr:uracil-DNA glycosylase [Rhodocyclaceae bacterium]
MKSAAAESGALLACTRCPRLAGHLAAARAAHPGYHARPVPPFGDSAARLLVVGLAPGMHGANRTGRPFTGDHAGILLYETLHRFGFADRAESVSAGDGLRLSDCRITNAVKCLPPANKPEPAEIRQCNGYLAAELADPAIRVVLALGRVAHEAALRALGLRPGDFAFAHGAEHALPDGRFLFDSYHCSRYNTQTRRLTPEAFRDVFAALRPRLG